ncbi:MAG: endonuclease [Muribaculaceae bacterium]|nr:endonuclease [Muribaculaceae bacterium]
MRNLLAAWMVVAVGTTWAAIPTGYYNSLSNKSGQALKNAIQDLVYNHTVVPYSSLWNYFPKTDYRIDNPQRVWDMYSDKAYYFRGSSSVSGMNKEHSFPKSWWGGGDDTPAYTDLNHLYPSDGDANMAKSNWPLGEVSSTTFDNGVTRVGTPVNGQGGGAGTVFEPADEYKGDFARTYFYMASCYQNLKWKYTYMVNNATWLTLNQWSIALLVRWAREDPVSEKERVRNDAVYTIQNNRNPFIDFPELFEYIWGDKQGQQFTLDGTQVDPGTPELITPTQGTVVDFGEVALGKSQQMVVYVKGMHLTNTLSLQLYRADFRMFSIPVTSVDRVAANSEDGYALTITYTPTAIGDHSAKLLISDGGLVGSVGVDLKASCVEPPTLSAITALPATGITPTSFVCNWRATDDVIDTYLVNITEYDVNHNPNSTLTFSTDETSYVFDERHEGCSYSYTVQSSRLGFTSVESNVINIDYTGITGVEADRPMAYITTPQGIIVKCSEPLAGVRVYNTAGQLVGHLDRVVNDDLIVLPAGVYVLIVEGNRRAVKVVIP